MKTIHDALYLTPPDLEAGRMTADACGQENSSQGTHLVRLPAILAGAPPAVKPKMAATFRPEGDVVYEAVEQHSEDSRSLTYYNCAACAQNGVHQAPDEVNAIAISDLRNGVAINICRNGAHLAGAR